MICQTGDKKTIDLDKRIAVIGVGYVGMPLTSEFTENYDVIGSDVNKENSIDSRKTPYVVFLNERVRCYEIETKNIELD